MHRTKLPSVEDTYGPDPQKKKKKILMVNKKFDIISLHCVKSGDPMCDVLN